MRLGKEFFCRDCLEVAPALVGKLIVRKMPDGELRTLRITETEAYRGEEDTACHAHKGRTKRTEILYGESGLFYLYLCYGIHWLMNVITGNKEQPQGVLIRACENYGGPGRLTKRLFINGEFNKHSATNDKDLWFEDDGGKFDILCCKRIGIGYASAEDQNLPWRFVLSK